MHEQNSTFSCPSADARQTATQAEAAEEMRKIHHFSLCHYLSRSARTQRMPNFPGPATPHRIRCVVIYN